MPLREIIAVERDWGLEPEVGGSQTSSHEQTVIVRSGPKAFEQRTDSGNLLGRFDGRRQLGVEIETVPVHLGQPKDLIAHHRQIRAPGVTADNERRWNAAFALIVVQTGIDRSRNAMHPKQG